MLVVCAIGGASITDSYLPVTDDECATPDVLSSIDPAFVFDIAGSPFRAVGLSESDPQVQFANDHHNDMVVMTAEGTSVNHHVAQHRALTGFGVNRGRTIAEAMAEAHGEGLPLPNCNMAAEGFLENGDDVNLPLSARAEIISDPFLFGVATDRTRGLLNVPGGAAMARARKVRASLEETSIFGRTFAGSAARGRYLDHRETVVPALEELELIDKMLLVEESEAIPLSDYGLQTAADLTEITDALGPVGFDSLEAQVALAYLLAKYGVSNALTFGPNFGTFSDIPLVFDYSHASHDSGQYSGWRYLMRALGGLVQLLQTTPWGSGTMWDDSLIYVATDFGRTRAKPAGAGLTEWGSGHHFNNGTVLISPRLNGNNVFGGVDPDTVLTYGFDPMTGNDAPGTVMREGHIYSAVAQAMNIDFDARLPMDALMG